MDDLANRAIEACKEYDRAKREIENLTEDIHRAFSECENRQEEEHLAKHPDADPWEVVGKFDPCLDLNAAGHEWDDNCNHCPKAYKHIQKRKDARQRLGIAKIKIRAVARAAYKQEDNNGS